MFTGKQVPGSVSSNSRRRFGCQSGVSSQRQRRSAHAPRSSITFAGNLSAVADRPQLM